MLVYEALSLFFFQSADGWSEDVYSEPRKLRGVGRWKGGMRTHIVVYIVGGKEVCGHICSSVYSR